MIINIDDRLYDYFYTIGKNKNKSVEIYINSILKEIQQEDKKILIEKKDKEERKKKNIIVYYSDFKNIDKEYNVAKELTEYEQKIVDFLIPIKSWSKNRINKIKALGFTPCEYINCIGKKNFYSITDENKRYYVIEIGIIQTTTYGFTALRKEKKD